METSDGSGRFKEVVLRPQVVIRGMLDSMKASEKASTRREPMQQRSRQTVEAVLEAVQRVLRRHGAEAITTNRVAEAAGVSIGSLYQYFPDKQAIFINMTFVAQFRNSTTML